MRLLNTHSFELEEFTSHENVEYAILSHRWRDEEVLFKDMDIFEASTKAGIAKVRSACQVARDDGVQYIWIDTCCIDKSSSAELGEAINSMFAWYRDSVVCYAYLDDVSMDHAQDVPFHSWLPQFRHDFARSSWFTRCWTLQELIAPQTLYFFDKDWRSLGNRSDNRHLISGCTGIPSEVLTSQDVELGKYCMAQKMSWASNRQASRAEDYAYSLLGIFNVAMPLNYGEGWKAFRRLQETILQATNDFTILAFEDYVEGDSRHRGTYARCLAEKPQQFAKSSFLDARVSRPSTFPDLSLEFKHDHLVLTTHVAHITQELFVAFICKMEDYGGIDRVYAILLRQTQTDSYIRLDSPSQLVGILDPGASNAGLCSPVLNHNFPTSLPRRRLYISADTSNSYTRKLILEPVQTCGFEVSDIVKLPATWFGHALRNSIMFSSYTHKVELASGAFRFQDNDKLVYIRVYGRDRYMPICNVYFSANERALLLAHFAIKVRDDGRISPICIMVDDTLPKHIPSCYTSFAIPNLDEIRKMQVNYSALCSRTPVPTISLEGICETVYTLNSGFRMRDSFQDVWVYMGHPCYRWDETDHFFMFKESPKWRSGRNIDTALLCGRVELKSNTRLQAGGGDTLWWKVRIEECYDSSVDQQKKLQRSTN